MYDNKIIRLLKNKAVKRPSETLLTPNKGIPTVILAAARFSWRTQSSAKTAGS